MNSLAINHSAQPVQPSTKAMPTVVKAGAIALCAALAAAMVRHLGGSGQSLAAGRNLLLVIHIATVLPAIPLGALVLTLPKGDARHRLLGRIWGGLMLVTAIASFSIRGLALEFSPIQPLSVLVVVTLWRAVGQARRGEIERHTRTMQRLYVGLLIAGLFTLLPGRLFGSWLLG